MNELLLDGLEKKCKWASFLEETHQRVVLVLLNFRNLSQYGPNVGQLVSGLRELRVMRIGFK